MKVMQEETENLNKTNKHILKWNQQQKNIRSRYSLRGPQGVIQDFCKK